MHFGVSLTIDERSGELQAAYFRIRKGEGADTGGFGGGHAFADYSKSGELLGIELIGPCNIRVLNQITQDEPADVRFQARRFLKENAPRGILAVS